MIDVLQQAEVLERIALVAKITTHENCENRDRAVAMLWIAELAERALEQLVQPRSLPKPPGGSLH
ncbi:hypothetical protein JK232_09515 [Nissabacter archeti]|uniref:Prophage protein n=1 Tax=Nissabacter archeti TaxID=1917880 RepID=A0ABS5JGP9_9GAMM|nr:hypothetical protein [Nissabacter archeti]MBS0969133.1 hypothetical protein [Nissabacter archeti]